MANSFIRFYPLQFSLSILLCELQGADFNKTDNKGLSPLLLSALKGSISACIRLLQLGADVAQVDENGRNVVTLLLFGGTGKSREAVPALVKVRESHIEIYVTGCFVQVLLKCINLETGFDCK